MTACSSSGDSDELLIYNAQHESLTKEWIDAFTKETGIKVTYRQGGDTEFGNQLVAEGDKSPADVFLTENSPAMAAVERQDCSPIWTPTLSIRFRRNTVRPPASGPVSRRAAPSSSTTRPGCSPTSCRSR